MADREWTSGPWQYSLGADGEYRIYAPCFPGASRAVFDIADVWLPDRGERHANGLLIASSPELFAALFQCERALRGATLNNRTEAEDAALRLAVSALAKATTAQDACSATAPLSENNDLGSK